MKPKFRLTKSIPRTKPRQYVDGKGYELCARYWKAMGSMITPDEAAKERGAFAVIDGVDLVYVG